MSKTSPQSVQRAVTTDSAIILFGKLSSIGVGIITSVLIARLLGAEGKGTLALLGLLVTQMALFASLGVEVSLIHYGGRSKWVLAELVNTALGIALVVSVPVLVLAWVFIAILANETVTVKSLWIAYLFCFSIPFYLWTLYLRSVVRVTGRLVEDTLLSSVGVLINLVLVIGVLFLGWDVNGVLVAMLLGDVANLVLYVLMCLRWNLVQKPIRFSVSIAKALIAYGMKGHLGSILQALNYRLDMYIVAFLLPIAQLGIYSVSVATAEFLWIIPNVLGPIIMQRAATQEARQVNSLLATMNRLTSASLVVSILIWIPIGLIAIPLLYGPAFVSAQAPFMLLLPGMWGLGLWKNLTNDLAGRGYPTYKSISSLVAVLLIVFFDLVLIPRMGIAGAALASSIAYCAALLAALPPYLRITGMSLSDLLLLKKADLVLAQGSVLRLLRRSPTVKAAKN